MNAKELLKEAAVVSQRHDETAKRTGAHFNLFEIAHIADKEVPICRVLCELLKPNGCHGQETGYLKLFFDHVLGIDVSEKELEQARVYREYEISEKRRIDLVIQMREHFIPIEVKIYAADQKGQICDYFAYAKNSKLYYLTLYGTPPSKESAASDGGQSLTPTRDGYAEVVNISFKEHILAWLIKCLEHGETNSIAPIRESIAQLISVIRKLTNQLEGEKKMEMMGAISRSSETMRVATEIEQALPSSRIDMLCKLFKSLDARLSRAYPSMHEMEDIFDYKYKDKQGGSRLSKFYDQRASTFPGISYPFTSANGRDIRFRIEVEQRLYAGFYEYKKDREGGEMLTGCKDALLHTEEKGLTDGYWCYLPGETDVPNFKDYNEAFYELFDPERFEGFLEKCIERMREILPCFYFTGNADRVISKLSPHIVWALNADDKPKKEPEGSPVRKFGVFNGVLPDATLCRKADHPETDCILLVNVQSADLTAFYREHAGEIDVPIALFADEQSCVDFITARYISSYSPMLRKEDFGAYRDLLFSSENNVRKIRSFPPDRVPDGFRPDGVCVFLKTKEDDSVLTALERAGAIEKRLDEDKNSACEFYRDDRFDLEAVFMSFA